MYVRVKETEQGAGEWGAEKITIQLFYRFQNGRVIAIGVQTGGEGEGSRSGLGSTGRFLKS